MPCILLASRPGFSFFCFFFFNDTATTEIYTLSLHDALPIFPVCMHNIEDDKIFRPASWNAFGMDKEGSDYRACSTYGPIYK